MKKAALDGYSYTRSGNMVGAYYCEEIRRGGEYAVLSITSAARHNEERKVSEYRIGAEVLPEIEAVFRKNHMKRWAHRKFTRIFVADGASKSYRFTFGEKVVSFSSQIYPERYRKPLEEIDEIIRIYSAPKTPLS